MFLNIRLKTAAALACAGLLVLLTAAVLPAALRGKAEDAPGKGTPDVTATDTDADPVEAPILMYHSVCVNPKVHSDYYITPEKLEGDLKYLRDHGYTTVFISEIADYAEGKGDLPEKPIALTFDDGYYNWLTGVLPLLEKYQMKATMNVVGAYAENEAQAENRSPAYSYLMWEEVQTLADSGLVEIKKKYEDVVYKRRIVLPAAEAAAYLRGSALQNPSQISREIDWLRTRLDLQAKVFIGYDREAFAGTEGVEDPELRITFDTALRYREDRLDLREGDDGLPLLPEGQVLMEIKIPGTAPLWLAHLLSENGIVSSSFSKYGTYYKNIVLKKSAEDKKGETKPCSTPSWTRSLPAAR